MTNHIDLINGTITIDLATYFMLGIIAIAFILFSMMLFFLALKIRQIVDRYRLKYGFDREIEKKEMNNPTEDKLNKRRMLFKKRTFTD